MIVYIKFFILPDSAPKYLCEYDPSCTNFLWYYKSRKNERWVIYSSDIEATNITSDWFLWIHHTTDKIPLEKDKKYSWQKKHLKNQTGTENSYKPIKIRKNGIQKKYETWK